MLLLETLDNKQEVWHSLAEARDAFLFVYLFECCWTDTGFAGSIVKQLQPNKGCSLKISNSGRFRAIQQVA